MQKSPKYTQKSPKYTQKSPVYAPREANGVHRGPQHRTTCIAFHLDAHKKHIYTQKSHVLTPKSPVKEICMCVCTHTNN